MHRKIVESVKKVIEDRLGEDCDVFIRAKDTGGFWGMVIIVDEKKKHFIAHIESIAMSIGSMYGEGLYSKRINEYTLYLD